MQGRRGDEDHEHGEAAQDDPHHSEPDGRPPGFQCESKGEASRRRSLSLCPPARGEIHSNNLTSARHGVSS